MTRRIALTLGILLIAGGLLGASLTWSALEGVSAQTNAGVQDSGNDHRRKNEGQRSQAHEQMHQMMDAMMGEGFTERMHAAMPGSEAMMEACASGMEGMMSGEGMMDGMSMDGMMDER